MTYPIWFLLCGGYLIFTMAARAEGAAKKQDSAEAALCFLDGVYLAMLCFAVLPMAMETAFFYGAAVLSAAGVAFGFWAEKRSKGKMGDAVLLIGLSTALLLLEGKELTFIETVPLAFFAGVGLYHASAGILPEPIRISRALLSAAGFLLGTVIFSPIL